MGTPLEHIKRDWKIIAGMVLVTILFSGGFGYFYAKDRIGEENFTAAINPHS